LIHLLEIMSFYKIFLSSWDIRIRIQSLEPRA
jgi:hypothetical protein